MTICIDCRMYFASGIGAYLQGLVPEIISVRPDYNFFLLGDTRRLAASEGLDVSNVTFIDCHAPIYSLSEQLSVVRKIPRCDLFFSPHYNVPLLYRGNMITTIHDIFHIADENSRQTTLRSLYARTMLSKALKKSKVVLTVSNFTLGEMQKYGLPCTDKVRVVYPGVRRNVWSSADSKREGNGDYLLYVGNVKPHKNLRRLVEAYRLLHRQNRISIPLKIVGEIERFLTGMPGFKDEIESSSGGGLIEFTGWVSDEQLKEYFKNAAAIIQPSIYEGFGLPPLEAMASGCPCAVSRAASLPEACGKAALYFDPYQVDDIAEKIYILLTNSDLRKELIRLGYEQAAKFDWRNTADAFLEAVECVVHP